MIYKGSQKIKDTDSYGFYKGSQPIGAIYHGNDKVYLFHRTFTWQAGTSLAEYKVPNYVNKIRVDCVASKGWNGGSTGGKGGRVQCYLNVTGGQKLYITVGEIPSGSATYNASDIRTNNSGVTNQTSLQSRLLVAGGGGSGSYGTYYVGYGGDGGGLTGAAGQTVNGGQGGGGGSGSYGVDWCGGGGGGSSYTDDTLCSDVVHTQGYQDGAGYITIEEIA